MTEVKTAHCNCLQSTMELLRRLARIPIRTWGGESYDWTEIMMMIRVGFVRLRWMQWRFLRQPKGRLWKCTWIVPGWNPLWRQRWMWKTARIRQIPMQGILLHYLKHYINHHIKQCMEWQECSVIFIKIKLVLIKKTLLSNTI